jgi:hypothetical protein
VARGDPVDGIGIVRYPDAVSGQLVTKSYRSRAGDRRGFLQLRHPLGQLLGPEDGGLPDPLTARGVESGEDLAPPAVQNGEPLALRPGLADPGRHCVQGADTAGRQTEADPEPARRRDPDPQTGEGAGAEADGDQVDRRPASRRRCRPLDLLEQAGRVQGPPLRGQPQLRLVEYLAVAPGAGDSVNRRGIEPDDDQGCATR